MTKAQRLALNAQYHEGSIRTFIIKHKLKRLAKWSDTKIWGNKFVIIKQQGTKILALPPENSVETYEVMINDDLYLVQPRVKPGDAESYNALCEVEPLWAAADGAEENCGWYENKPVIIDW